MRGTLARLLIAVSVVAAAGQTLAQSVPGWNLTFDDEFNGTSLDTTKWTPQYRWSPTPINNELEYYVPSAVTESGGYLNLTASKLTTPIVSGGVDYYYTSGVVTTYQKFSQSYGMFEINCKVPAGNGFWPAFWLLPEDESWPPEIDVFEILGQQPNTAYFTYHYQINNDGQNHGSGSSSVGPNYSAGFHTFSIIWNPAEIVWYVDGVEQFQTTNYITSKPMYMLANLAVGGSWPVPPDSSTPFPSAMTIDYIRAYASAGMAGNWNSASGGTWSNVTSSGWNAGSFPHSTDDSATFSQALAAGATVTLDTPVTLGGLVLNDSSGAYGWTIASSNPPLNTVTFSSTPNLAYIASQSGNHTLNAPVVLASPLTINVTGASLTMSGPISGTGSITTAGTGSLILSGSNSFGGALNAAGGTVQIGNGGNSGTLGSGPVSNNAALVFSRSDSGLSVSNVISGSGSLTQIGAGAITLAAANTYTGATLVSNGTLVLGNGLAIQDSTLNTSGSGALSFGSLASAAFGGLAGSGNLVLANSAGTASVNLSVGANNASTTFSGTLSDNATGARLTKVGSGMLTLSGANTYSGGTYLDNGTLSLSSSAALGSGTLTINGGGLYHSSGYLTLSNNPQVWNGSFTVNNPISTTLNLGSGNVALNNNIQITAGAGWGSVSLVVGGVISNGSGNYGLTIMGGANSGAIYLTGNNAFGGGATLGSSATSGVLAIGNSSALGSGTLTINNGTIEGAYNPIVSNPIIWNGPLTFTNNAGLPNFGSSVTFTGNVALTGNRTVNSNILTGWAFKGVISDGGGNYSLTDAGGGYSNSLALGGANTFGGGVTFTSGAGAATLDIGNLGTGPGNSALGTGSFTIGPNTATASIDNSSGAAGTLATNNAQVWNGDFTFVGSKSLNMGTGAVSMGTAAGATRTVTVSTNTLTIGGVISNGLNAATPTVNLTKAGAGGLALGGANTFSGNTSVTAGTLDLTNSLALQNSTLATGGTGLVLDAAATNNAFTLGGLSGTGGLALQNSASRAIALSVGNNGGNTTYSGALSAAGSLSKVGSGVLTLAGANVYSGFTQVNAGVLAAGAVNTLSRYSNMRVGTSTAGTLDVSGFSGQTVQSLSIGSLGALNVAIGNPFTSLGAVNLASGSTINISGTITSTPELLMTYNTGAGLTGSFSHAFYQGGLLPSGDSLSYTGGSVEVVSTPPFTGFGTWIGTTNFWNANTNWTDGVNSGVPGNGSRSGNTDTATFSGSGTTTVITLDITPNVAALSFSGTNYTLTGGSLTLQQGTTNSGTATVTVTSGSQTIASDVEIAGGNLAIALSHSGILAISGNVSDDLGLRSLTLAGDGSGQLILSGTNSYGGGTNVNAGILYVTNSSAIPGDKRLSVGAGGTFIFDPNSPAGNVATLAASPATSAVEAVPEPGTLALLTAAVCGAAVCQRLRSRRKKQ